MLIFLIVISIMLIVLCADFRETLKTGRRGLTALYAVLAGLSLALTTFYCFAL